MLFYNHILEQETLSIAPREVPTDNGVTKEFDPLRNSKEERSKTPQSAQQVKREFHSFYSKLMEINKISRLTLGSDYN